MNKKLNGKRISLNLPILKSESQHLNTESTIVFDKSDSHRYKSNTIYQAKVLKTEPSVQEAKFKLVLDPVSEFIPENEKQNTKSTIVSNNTIHKTARQSSRFLQFQYQNLIQINKSKQKKVPMNIQFYQKLDVNEKLFLEISKKVCNEINELSNQIKSKIQLTKCLNKILNEGLLTIKALYLEGEKFDLLEKYTPEIIHQRLIQKSFYIFKSLQRDTKDHFQLLNMKPNEALIIMMNNFHEKLFEINEQRREDNMEIMKNKILAEWQQVHDIISINNYKRLLGKLLYKDNSQFTKSTINLSVEQFPSKSPAVDIDFAELAYGTFNCISKQQRRYDAKLNQMINQVKEKGLHLSQRGSRHFK